MQLNKKNILYTIAAVIVIMAMGFFVAITSLPVRQAGVFWISLYLVILLIGKILRAGRNRRSAYQLN